MSVSTDNDKPKPPPSRAPAHELWVEVSTRIAAQDLHFRSGKEEAAVKSIVDLFATTRDLMRRNPDADQFSALAVAMLETIRPYTARWHGLQDANNRFPGPVQRHQFREELRELQPTLTRFALLLQKLSQTGDCGPIPPIPKPAEPTLGDPVPMGIDLELVKTSRASADGSKSSAEAGGAPARSAKDAFARMNREELSHIQIRRGIPVVPDATMSDGTGLALSGGGIRSATFSLGVIQVLAEARLLTRFDYLSTVSGGGYLGSFLSNQFTEEDATADAAAAKDRTLLEDPRATPGEKAAAQARLASYAEQIAASAPRAFDAVFCGSADSTALRHLRNSSKYLLPMRTIDRLKLAGLLVSGVLATSLLVVVLPVLCALLVHMFDRVGLLDARSAIKLFGHEVLPLRLATGVAIGAMTTCWLVRPITAIWRHWRGRLDSIAAGAAIVAGVLGCVVLTPVALSLVGQFVNLKITASITSLTSLASGAAVIKAIGVVWKYRKAVSRLFMLSGVVLFVLVYLALFRFLHVDATAAPPPETLTAGSISITRSELIVLALLVLWLVWDLFLNLNLTGLHRFYRGRLARCYLRAPTPSRGIPEPPPLQTLAAKLPYQLINTTVNLTSSDNPDLRGRGGDFFLLSQKMCGSILTGYQDTAQLAASNPDLDLATAMAVSGAAASTRMGWQTLNEYRTLMAIFNIRLGYWLRWRQDPRGWLAANAFVELSREIFGWLNERSSTLNLSDGGHIENLAAYELIRRKLRFIVCVDGGMDPGMNCADLDRLQRLVAIDFGYRLHFDAADLKLTGGFSSSYGILVKIDYTPDVEAVAAKQLGWMLYIKLAMLGTEANYVLDYRRENPQFPHQSTADQFFDEAQFEAYRKLGESAAGNFLPKDFRAPEHDPFGTWFLGLARDLLRDTDPVYVAAPAPMPRNSR